MAKSQRNLINTRSFVDFAAKLSAKWRLGTTPTKLQAPSRHGNAYESMDAILGQLVGYPTVTGNTEALHDALDYIQAYLLERGMHTRRLEHGSVESLVATTRKTKTPKVLLAAHLDVVAAPEQMFTMQESKDKLYGRGVLDMKSAIATFMQTIDTISSDLSKYDVGIMITSDEEAGGDAGTGYVIDKGYLPEVCILPDGGDNWQIETHAKGYLFLSITANGKPAHASRPWDGKNAINAIIVALQDILALFPVLTPATDTVNIGKITGGSTVNQVAGHAEAIVDVRVISEERKAVLLQQIEQICEMRGVQLALVSQGITVALDINEPHVASFARIVADTTGIKITGSSTMGTNDARFLIAKGVPCISYYPIGGGHHSADEWVDKIAFHQSYDVILRFIGEHARP